MAKSSYRSNGLRSKPLRVPPSSWQFGTIIGQRRAQLGLSQDAAVALIRQHGRENFARQTLSGLESGKKPSASYDAVCAIADAYGLDRIALWKIAKGDSDILSHDAATPLPVVTGVNAAFTSAEENPFPSPPLAASSPARRFDVPVMATQYAEGIDKMYLSETVVDYALRPAGIDRATAVFAFRHIGESMMPAIRGGTLLYADAGRPALPGDDVLIDFLGSDAAAGYQIVRRLVSSDESQITVKHYELDQETESYRKVVETFPRSAIKRLVHILTVNELLGFI